MSEVFSASRDGRKPCDVCLRAQTIRRGRKSLSTFWCERVKKLWTICSTVAVVTWTRDGKRMGTGGLVCLHFPLRLEELWKTWRRLNPLPLLPVWPRDLPQSHTVHTNSVQRGDCNWWIPRFSLLWADVEPWYIYSHVGTVSGSHCVLLSSIYPAGYPLKSNKWFLILSQRRIGHWGMWEMKAEHRRM